MTNCNFKLALALALALVACFKPRYRLLQATLLSLALASFKFQGSNVQSPW